MNQLRTHVIVGGGLAGAEAAKTLRAEGFDGPIVLVAAESRLPYERPALSKDYLRGETPVEKLLAQPEAFYEREGVELVLGRRAIRLDLAGRVVVLDDGREVAFDRLLLATGAVARRLGNDGPVPPWAHVLRTVEDADRLRAAARDAETAVVAGGGWIAAEVAASLRQLGLDVTLVVPRREVLERSLGQQVAARYSDLHRAHGVHLVTGARALELVDAPAGRGIRLSTGELVSADLVVLGLGAIPALDLAREAGIATDDGVLVDAQLATSVPGVYAAGDIASAWHPRYGERVRSEHWDNARRQARTAARNMLGHGEAYERIPYFYSDQYERGMELLGRPELGDAVRIRDETGDDAFVALWLRGGRVIAGLHANVWDAKRAIDRLVGSAAAIDEDRFAAGAPLDELAAEAA